jgi:hypothetical protein
MDSRTMVQASGESGEKKKQNRSGVTEAQRKREVNGRAKRGVGFVPGKV